jgi:hypothetical protein
MVPRWEENRPSGRRAPPLSTRESLPLPVQSDSVFDATQGCAGALALPIFKATAEADKGENSLIIPQQQYDHVSFWE